MGRDDEPVARLLTDLAWPVTTQRLSIRPAEQRDAAATFAFRALPEVAEWVTSQTTDFASWEAGYGARLADTLVIELDGDVVGDLMLRVQDGWAQTEVKEQAVGTEAEIGYTLAPTHGGQGLATEAVRAPHGTPRHASRAAHQAGLAPPERAVARRDDVRDPRRRVAQHPLISRGSKSLPPKFNQL